jgi:hypothetical protein
MACKQAKQPHECLKTAKHHKSIAEIAETNNTYIQQQLTDKHETRTKCRMTEHRLTKGRKTERRMSEPRWTKGRKTEHRK